MRTTHTLVACTLIATFFTACQPKSLTNNAETKIIDVVNAVSANNDISLTDGGLRLKHKMVANKFGAQEVAEPYFNGNFSIFGEDKKLTLLRYAQDDDAEKYLTTVQASVGSYRCLASGFFIACSPSDDLIYEFDQIK